jgi:hypothetical protein
METHTHAVCSRPEFLAQEFLEIEFLSRGEGDVKKIPASICDVCFAKRKSALIQTLHRLRSELFVDDAMRGEFEQVRVALADPQPGRNFRDVL